MAAAIRLGMYGQQVLLVERHNAPGGLNSFYFLGGRKYDVGLHAVTNFAPPGTRGAPLGRVTKQLRIPREALGLCPQQVSRIAFPGVDLRFGNGPELLVSEVVRAFPAEATRFRALVGEIEGLDGYGEGLGGGSAREWLKDRLREPLLREMVLCPLMYYGSARAGDLDLDQFVILFRSIYLEGFARPYEGVRRVIRVLLERLRAVGVTRKMKCGVRRLEARQGSVVAAELDDGTVVEPGRVISTIGAKETLALLGEELPERGERLSFVETITVLREQPRELGWEDTIVFFNDSERFEYGRPGELCDARSGVICFPNNYQYAGGAELPEGLLRVTALADYTGWKELPETSYRAAKAQWRERLEASARRFLPAVELSQGQVLARDMFTPRTVEKFTGHLEGAVYGSPQKWRDGHTRWGNLRLAGTDQGFLGIVGALVSGIAVANGILSED